MFYQIEKAIEIAKNLLAQEEDDWDYQVVSFDNGLAKIEVYDEAGNMLGYFGA